MSVYIQITSRCNMACDHCCFACNKTEGEDMSIQTFFKAIGLAENYGEHVTLGGGEPTIHPKFWEFFGITMGSNIDSFWMATNGKKSNIAMKLANIAMDNEYFDIALSQDPWHDPIKPDVIRLFKGMGHEIRDVSYSPYGDTIITNIGSAYENGLGTTDDCACPGLHINPDGTLKMCGCLDSLELGNIHDLDDTVIDRVNEVTYEYGKECGRDLNQKHIDYIIDNVEFDKEEAA